MNRLAPVLAASALSCATTSQTQRAVLDAYPVVTIDAAALPKSRDFFAQTIGLDVIFDSSWFVALGDGSTGRINLALMSHDHPSSPPGPEVTNGQGLLVTVQVADAAATHEKLTAAGVAIEHPLRDEPWGQKRFMVRDPSGLAVDVVEQTQPKDGYWEQYPPKP